MTVAELRANSPTLKRAADDYLRADRVVRVLWHGDSSVTQGEACVDINWLIQLMGGDSEAVVPDRPDDPAGLNFGLLHILEASAVLSEEVRLDMYQIQGCRKERLLRRNDRDFSLYF